MSSQLNGKVLKIDTAEKEKAMLFDLAAIFAVLISVMFWYSSASLQNKLFAIVALTLYLMATVFTILGGATLKEIVSPDERAVFNNRFHKWIVAAVNGLMGLACLVYLIFVASMSEARLPLFILVGAGCLYALTWATRLIRPHSFWARFRSVLMRALLTTIVCGAIWWPWGFVVAPAVALPLVIKAWRHLRRDQAVFGWAER